MVGLVVTETGIEQIDGHQLDGGENHGENAPSHDQAKEPQAWMMHQLQELIHRLTADEKHQHPAAVQRWQRQQIERAQQQVSENKMLKADAKK